MIKVLADKILAFDRGEKDKKGHLVTVKTKIGFCELPDWAAETDYFKAAIAEGSLKPFQSSGDSEAVLKAQEKLTALKAEIADLEEKKMAMVGAPLGDSNGVYDGKAPRTRNKSR